MGRRLTRAVLDTQQIEIAGRNRLISELVAAGIEVARPERDRGIDLIAYLDRSGSAPTFRAVPIQMKASTAECFSVNAKYAQTKGLILAYVWHVHDPTEAATFAMRYDDALFIAKRMGYTKTDSWRRGEYFTSRPSQRLREILAQFRTSNNSWLEQFRRFSAPETSRRHVR